MRVFIVGLPKCGTTSLDIYLSTAGFKTWQQSVEKDGKRHSLQNKILESYIADEPLLTKADEILYTENIAYTQVDEKLGNGHLLLQMNFLERIIKEYPDSKFILNYRDVKNHEVSFSKWGDLKNRITCSYDLASFIFGFNKIQFDVLTKMKVDSLYLNIESTTAGEALDNFFGINNKHNWGIHNKSK